MRWLYDSFGSNPNRAEDDHAFRQEAWSYCAKQRHQEIKTLKFTQYDDYYSVVVYMDNAFWRTFMARRLGGASFWKQVEKVVIEYNREMNDGR